MVSLKSLLFGDEAFCDCSRVVFESELIKGEWLIGLPALTTIQFGFNAFCFNDKDEASELVMKSDSDDEKW